MSTPPTSATSAPVQDEQPTTEKVHELIEELATFMGLLSIGSNKSNSGASNGQSLGGLMSRNNKADRRVIAGLIEGASGGISGEKLLAALKGPASATLKNMVSVYMHDKPGHVASGLKVKDKTAHSFKQITGLTYAASSGAKITNVCINSTVVSPATFNTRIVELFFNAMPSTVLSMATPYLRIDVITDRSGDLYAKAGGTVKPSIPKGSLYFYLEGAKNVDETSSIVKAQPKRFTESNQGNAGHLKGFGVAGSEIFLSPQTLVSTDSRSRLSGVAAGRRSKIIDPFQPLASIKSLSLNVTSAGGLQYYKNGNLQLRLHDRSRLDELSELVSPRFMGSTYLVITSGYRVPNPAGNIFARVLNQMRTTEVYRVYNTSYVLSQTGGFDINISIATEGSQHFEFLDTGSTHGSLSEGQNIRALREHIATLVQQNQSTGALAQRGQVLPAFVMEGLNDRTYTNEVKAQIEACLAAGISSIKSKLEELARALTNKNNDTGRQRLGATKSKLDKAFATGKDPWLPNEGNFSTKQWISLGKLVATLHGQSILAFGGGSIKEFQFIYYPFNANAARMRSRSVASFPIKKAPLYARLTKYFQDNRRANLPLQAMFNIIQSDFVKKDDSPAYGLSNVDLVGAKGGSGPRQVRSKGRSANTYGGTFQRPHVTIYMSTTSTMADDGEPASLTGDMNIVRIHIFDMNSTPYTAAKALLLGDVGAAQSFNRTDFGEFDGTLFGAQLQQLLSKGLISTSAAGDAAAQIAAVLAGNATVSLHPISSKVAEVMPKLAPAIRYGTSASVIKAAGLSSLTHSGLLSARLSSTPAGAGSPTGGTTGNMPQEILPTQVSFSILGCPFLSFGQQLYIDFDTGTNADNIYMISKLSHTFAPGSFTSNFTAMSIYSYGTFASMQATVQQGIAAVSAKQSPSS